MVWYLACLGGRENQEAEDEYNRTAHASWGQRMITSLFSDSALFNTREGRAGKVLICVYEKNILNPFSYSPTSFF